MARGGQQQPSGDNSTDFLWIMVGVIIAGAMVWYFGKAKIIPIVFAIKEYQIHFIHFFLQATQSLIDALGLSAHLAVDTVSLKQWQAYMALNVGNAAQIEFNTVRDLNQAVGSYLRYPVAAIFGLLAFYVSFSSVVAKFKTVFNMKKLREAERENWPQISPICGTDLVKQPLDEGPWAMSLQPMQFVRKYNLVREIVKEGQPAIELIEGAAHRQFITQLGPVWTGLQGLPPYVLALFAIFAAKADGNAKGAERLMKQISQSSHRSGRLNFLGTRPLLIKHVRSTKVGRAVGMHAYMTTVMASMLELARTDGVLATSDFLWLKLVDRRLWYMLNVVGRRTAFPEIAGAYAHWLVECRLRRPLKVPMVDEAVIALGAALQDIKFNPETM